MFKRYNFSPVTVFFSLAALGSFTFSLAYYTAYLHGDISLFAFIFAILLEFTFLIFDLFFIYAYTLYVANYLDVKRLGDKDLLVAKFLDRFFPLSVKKMLLSFAFPFYREHLSGPVSTCVSYTSSCFGRVKIWFKVPASFSFLVVTLLFFTTPVLYFFYNLDLTLEFGDFGSVCLFAAFFDGLVLVYYFYYLWRSKN